MAVEVVWVTEIGRRLCGSDAVLRLSGLQQFKRLNHVDHCQPVVNREFPICRRAKERPKRGGNRSLPPRS